MYWIGQAPRKPNSTQGRIGFAGGPVRGRWGRRARMPIGEKGQMRASKKNGPCHPPPDSDLSIGRAPPTEPPPPAIICKPMTTPHCRGGYHSVNTLIAAIKPP